MEHKWVNVTEDTLRGEFLGRKDVLEVAPGEEVEEKYAVLFNQRAGRTVCDVSEEEQASVPEEDIDEELEDIFDHTESLEEKTNDELRKMLEEEGIEYNARDTKKELIERFQGVK